MFRKLPQYLLFISYSHPRVSQLIIEANTIERCRKELNKRIIAGMKVESYCIKKVEYSMVEKLDGIDMFRYLQEAIATTQTSGQKKRLINIGAKND